MMGGQRKAWGVRQKRSLKGERRCRSEDVAWSGTFRGCFDFWSIAPWQVWVQVPLFPRRLLTPCKIGSCAINAPLKTPRSRGGFCCPSVILFGKRDSDCRYFPCLLRNLIARCVQPSPVGRKENKAYFSTSFSKLGVGEISAWPEMVVIIQG